MKQHQEQARGHLVTGTSSSTRHDAEAPASSGPVTKGCATFLVGAKKEGRRRFTVPVALLGHPRILELLGEAREEYGYTHDNAILVPCGADRFQKAVDAAKAKQRHHHSHFGLPCLAGCCIPRTPFLRIHARG